MASYQICRLRRNRSLCLHSRSKRWTERKKVSSQNGARQNQKRFLFDLPFIRIVFFKTALRCGRLKKKSNDFLFDRAYPLIMRDCFFISPRKRASFALVKRAASPDNKINNEKNDTVHRVFSGAGDPVQSEVSCKGVRRRPERAPALVPVDPPPTSSTGTSPTRANAGSRSFACSNTWSANRNRRAVPFTPRYAQSQIIASLPLFLKMGHILDLRCVLLPALWVPGVPTKTRLESSIHLYMLHNG